MNLRTPRIALSLAATAALAWAGPAAAETPQTDGTVNVSTVYRTLDLLEKGGFVESLDTGQGGLVYEHVLGHKHHDHMICEVCGRIEEFHEERIEQLQDEAARARGFQVTGHVHRLKGICKVCVARLRREGGLEERLAALRGQ